MNRRTTLALVLLLSACNPPEAPLVLATSSPPYRDLPPPPTTTTTSSTTPRTTTTRASRSSNATSAVEVLRPMLQSGVRLSSTAYCETGRMANGQHTYLGAVAGNRWPLGTILHVSDGPHGPGRYTVADRIGHGSDLDFALPGDCAAARRWGRRTVTAEVVR